MRRRAASWGFGILFVAFGIGVGGGAGVGVARADEIAAPAPAVRPPAPKRIDGDYCRQDSDCASGACEARGCKQLGRCVAPDRKCAQLGSSVAWCTCDADTIMAPVKCPGERVLHKGECTKRDRPQGLPTKKLPPPRKPKVPTAPDGAALYACAAPSDCTVIFVGRDSCYPSDPRAVAVAQRDAAFKALSPNRRPPVCGIGGPAYERQLMDILARYSATCEANRCTLVDRGEAKSPPR